MKTRVTCALCCTAQYNTFFFSTKIRKIFTVRRKTRKLSKIRKTCAKNVRLDRYETVSIPGAGGRRLALLHPALWSRTGGHYVGSVPGNSSLLLVLGVVGWLIGCLTSQQHASVCPGRTPSDNFTCCHTEIEVADQTFHLTQSQYTDTGPTSPSADPTMPGDWQGSHWSANL